MITQGSLCLPSLEWRPWLGGSEIKKLIWEPGEGGWSLVLCEFTSSTCIQVCTPTCYMILGKLLHLYEPHGTKNSSYLMAFLLEKNERVYINCLEWCLAHSKCSVWTLGIPMFPCGALGDGSSCSIGLVYTKTPKSTGKKDERGLETGALELRLSRKQDHDYRIRAATPAEAFLRAQHYLKHFTCTNLLLSTSLQGKYCYYLYSRDEETGGQS